MDYKKLGIDLDKIVTYKDLTITNIKAIQKSLNIIDFELTKKEKQLVNLKDLENLNLNELEKIEKKLEKIENKYFI